MHASKPIHIQLVYHEFQTQQSIINVQLFEYQSLEQYATSILCWF